MPTSNKRLGTTPDDCLQRVPPPSPSMPRAAGSGLIPAVEPPAPVAARIRPPSRRNWWVQRWREVPCWLTSLVLHLSTVIVLGTLIAPARQLIATQLVMFLEGGSDPTSDATFVRTVTFEAPVDSESTPAQEITAKSTPIEVDLREQLAKLSPPADEVLQHLPPEPSAQPVETPSAQIAGTLAAPGEPTTTVPGPDSPQPAGSGIADVSSILAEIGIPPSLTAATNERTTRDNVVDRFIAFDVGRLAGADALAARRDFEHLGPDAIRELVRGLNKSAYVAASCPVIVISDRLAKALAQTDDPQLIQYAVDNIGRGVPKSAPYADRLRAFRDELMQGTGSASIRSELARHGISPTKQVVETTRKIYELSPEKLMRVISGRDSRRAAAARVAVTLRRNSLPSNFQLQVAQELTEQLAAASPAEASSIQRTLTALYEQLSDEAPASLDGAPTLTADDWQRRWEEVDSGFRTKFANNLLAEAIDVEQKTGPLSAAQRYQRVVEMFPDSTQAAEAQRRLSELDLEPAAAARLRLAETIEDRGDRSAAIRAYRHVMEKCPGTPSAEKAEFAIRRLERAQP